MYHQAAATPLPPPKEWEGKGEYDDRSLALIFACRPLDVTCNNPYLFLPLSLGRVRRNRHRMPRRYCVKTAERNHLVFGTESSSAILYCVIRKFGYLKIRVLPSGTFSQTLDLEKFCRGTYVHRRRVPSTNYLVMTVDVATCCHQSTYDRRLFLAVGVQLCIQRDGRKASLTSHRLNWTGPVPDPVQLSSVSAMWTLLNAARRAGRSARLVDVTGACQVRVFDTATNQWTVTHPLRTAYYSFISAVIFFLPIVTMTVAYALIIWKLWSSKRPGEALGPELKTYDNVKKRVNKSYRLDFDWTSNFESWTFNNWPFPSRFTHWTRRHWSLRYSD